MGTSRTQMEWRALLRAPRPPSAPAHRAKGARWSSPPPPVPGVHHPTRPPLPDTMPPAPPMHTRRRRRRRTWPAGPRDDSDERTRTCRTWQQQSSTRAPATTRPCRPARRRRRRRGSIHGRPASALPGRGPEAAGRRRRATAGAGSLWGYRHGGFGLAAIQAATGAGGIRERGGGGAAFRTSYPGASIWTRSTSESGARNAGGIRVRGRRSRCRHDGGRAAGLRQAAARVKPSGQGD